MAKTYETFTARRVLTVEWLEGEKLSQSNENDVGALVNLGVICYLKQLLQTGFFHAGALLLCLLPCVTSHASAMWVVATLPSQNCTSIHRGRAEVDNRGPTQVPSPASR